MEKFSELLKESVVKFLGQSENFLVFTIKGLRNFFAAEIFVWETADLCFYYYLHKFEAEF